MRAIPLVRLFWVHPVLQLFRDAGRPVDRFLAEAGLPPEVDQDLELAFPSSPLYDVIDSLVRDSGRHDLGLKIGQETHLWSLGPFGRQVAGQATLGDAIATARELMASVHTARRLTLSTSGGVARLASRLETSQLTPTLWDDQFTLSLLIDLVRSVAGPHWLPDKAAVQVRARRQWPAGSGLDGTTIRCGAAATAIDFPQGLLTCSVASSCRQRYYRTPMCRRGVDLEALPTDLAGCLRVTLDALVIQGQTDAESLARVAGTSVRTLQRRLSERGWSFSELLADTRLALARQRLIDPSVNVVDIAFEVGYSDPAHFTRAFRGWTGQSPIGYRETIAP